MAKEGTAGPPTGTCCMRSISIIAINHRLVQTTLPRLWVYEREHLGASHSSRQRLDGWFASPIIAFFRSTCQLAHIRIVTGILRALRRLHNCDTTATTSTTTRSCRDPGTAAIHFWLPDGVRRRTQRVTFAGSGGRRDTPRPPPLLLRPCAAIDVAADAAV